MAVLGRTWCIYSAAAKSHQSCPALCDPIDGSPPGSPVPGILQARTLEWVAISFSNAWKWKVKEKSLSRVRLFATAWTAAYQAPLPVGFSRQEYWSGVSLPSPETQIEVISEHDSTSLSWVLQLHKPPPQALLWDFTCPEITAVKMPESQGHRELWVGSEVEGRGRLPRSLGMAWGKNRFWD